MKAKASYIYVAGFFTMYIISIVSIVIDVSEENFLDNDVEIISWSWDYDIWEELPYFIVAMIFWQVVIRLIDRRWELKRK